MIEFTLSDREYRADKLDGFEQLKVAKRLAPLLDPVMPLALSLGKVPKEERLARVLALISSPETMRLFTRAIHDLPDDDMKFILETTMLRTKRLEGSAYVPIWIKGAGPIQDDLNDAGPQLAIAVRVVQHSLGNFLQGLLTSGESQPST